MPIGRPLSLTPNIARKVVTSTASGVTTNFTVTGGYRVVELGVYLNGVRLIDATDYTARDGSTVGLTTAAVDGDVISFQIFDSFNIADAINQNSSDQTINGSLTLNDKLTVAGIGSFTDVVSSGIVTADSFYGSGANLTNLPASATGVPGISTTGFSTFKDISAQGITTISNLTASTSTTTGALIVSGGVGIAKSLFVGEGISVGGTITYADVTNVDSVGIVTAGKGFRATTGGITMVGVATLGAVGASGTTIHVHGDGRITGVLTASTFSGYVEATTVDATTVEVTTINVGAGITLTASGIVNAGVTTITGATETVTGVTTYPLAGRKVTVECDAAKGTVFSHDLANGNVGIVSLTNLPVRGNSFTTYTIIFTQLSSTPVGNGNTTPRNGIGTNVFLDGGFTGFTTTAKVATASTVTLSTTASDLDIVTLGVHYNGGTTTVPANWAVFANGNSGFRFGTWGY